MSAGWSFERETGFTPEQSAAILRAIPAAPGVFALRGPTSADGTPSEPYLARTADLRRRLRRLLAPPEDVDEQGRPVLSKRLNLRDRVAHIAYTRTGSEFESALTLYCATRAAFGAQEARRRLRLHAPFVVRITMQHEHPRAYVTNRLSARSLADSFGPFPSRAAAERYCDAVLDLFKLRRCSEDLEVSPSHPGCAYGEMNKCLQPCKAACTPEAYAAEAAAVRSFFATGGESMLAEIAQKRDTASEAMDFEAAAGLHRQYEKVKAAATLADDLVRPIPEVRALIVQQAAPAETSELHDEAAIFLLAHGRIVGPARLSTLGVRAVREQTAVGSSLFAQPLMLAAVPLDEPSGELASQRVDESTSQQGSEPAISLSRPERSAAERPAVSTAVTLSPEERARIIIEHLEALAATQPPIDELCDNLALFRRWYYRPEKQRPGEVLLPNPDRASSGNAWPIRRLLNAAARVVLGPPAELPTVDREAFKDLKTKVIHPGREGVERTVPVLPSRKRTRKSITPTDVLDDTK